MRKIIYAAVMLVSTWVLAACGSNDNGGGDARPTSWVVTSSLDPTTAQPVVITSSELPAEIAELDLMAAFVGNQCLAVSAPSFEETGKYFSLVVMAPVEDDLQMDVELRYYSATQERIYISETFSHCPGNRLGSISGGGYQPKWK